MEDYQIGTSRISFGNRIIGRFQPYGENYRPNWPSKATQIGDANIGMTHGATEASLGWILLGGLGVLTSIAGLWALISQRPSITIKSEK